MVKERNGSGTAGQVEQDAEGQFAREKKGATNSGVSSAKPRVVTGDEDATFDKDPGGTSGSRSGRG